LRFDYHPELAGKHAFLSPSNYSWIRYEDDKMLDRLDTSMDAALGTRLHEVAKELIELGINLPDDGRTLSLYVNDAIGFRMSPEVSLMASYNAFGTADAISFRKERPTDERLTLRIHDLKTGKNTAKFDQLEIYAAFFCLEYQQQPNDIDIELRLYQNDGIRVYEPDRGDIMMIMAKTRHFDELINNRRLEALG